MKKKILMFTLFLLVLGIGVTAKKNASIQRTIFMDAGKIDTRLAPTNGIYLITFHIYDGMDGTNVLYTETLPVEVKGGSYRVELGYSAESHVMKLALANTNAFMQITVGSEKLPREKIQLADMKCRHYSPQVK